MTRRDKPRRLTKRKLRRAEQQAAVDAVYLLCEMRVQGPRIAPAPDGLLTDDLEPFWSYLDGFDRLFRCPRCGGYGEDPEQPSQSYPPTDPPDPCGLCNGMGTIGRPGLEMRIDRAIDYAHEEPPWD